MSYSQYILGKRIARGGMAEIYLGKAVGSDDFQRICAIKKILPHYAQEKEYIEMFRAEASICKRLQHANIVQVFDFKKVNDSYAIIMEFVDGTDLRSLLAACEKAQTRPTIPMAIYIAAQAARGLHYAHTKTDEVTNRHLEIVHRDISPQNLLLSFEGEVKVIDFGIAKFDANQQETKPGIVKGKYSYMSPEQVSAKPLDARTDVFSLAVVLWEMLAMKRLFTAETEVETIRNVQSANIRRSLLDLNPDVDQELLTIVLTGLARDRKKRYTSAAAFEKDLVRYLNKRYPDFTATDLGTFVKDVFKDKRQEMSKSIQTLLTTSSYLPGRAQHIFSNGEPKLERINTAERRAAESNSNLNRVELNIDVHNIEQVPLATGTFGNASSINNREPSRRNVRNTNSIAPNNDNSRLIFKDATAWPKERPNANLRLGVQKWATQIPKNRMVYGLIATMLIASAALLLAKRNANQRAEMMQLNLATNPNMVSIVINGKLIENGTYIETPRRFNLPPGKHNMTIIRENYLPRRVEIEGRGGDQLKAENIQLILDPKVRTHPVRVTTESGTGPYVVINQGLHRGRLPLALDDLSLGKKYTLSAFPNYPSRDGAFRCDFVVNNRRPIFNLRIVLPKGSKTARCLSN